MTEQEYIHVRDLSNVRTAALCIQDLNAGCSVMSEKERAEVIVILARWEDQLRRKIQENLQE